MSGFHDEASLSKSTNNLATAKVLTRDSLAGCEISLLGSCNSSIKYDDQSMICSDHAVVVSHSRTLFSANSIGKGGCPCPLILAIIWHKSPTPPPSMNGEGTKRVMFSSKHCWNVQLLTLSLTQAVLSKLRRLIIAVHI